MEIQDQQQARLRRTRGPTDSPMSEGMQTPSPRRRRGSGWKTIVLILIILILAGVAGYSRYQLYRLKDPNYQQAQADQQTKSIIDQVSQLMELPDGTPQIATVSDVDKLKATQPFFIKAQNGDDVLIYPDEAILYSPSKHKIINVAPVTRDQTAPQTTNTTPAAATKTTATASSSKKTVTASTTTN